MNIEIKNLTGKKILVAISGGIDSVVLAHILYAHGIELLLAHCNFQLRSEESDADETFVRTFAQELGVPLEVKRFNTHWYAEEHQLNTQLAARELRYQWFYELASTHFCDAIATAHHANDNLETFFINLSRGSGLDGLLGIPEEKGIIIRPLLQFSRQQIYEYAQAKRLKWREDSSNASNKYVRNVIRHDIVPKLALVHPNYLENFNQTQEYLHQSARFIDFYIEQLKESCFEGDNPIQINTEKLQVAPELDFVLHKLFYPYGFSNVKDLKNLLLNAEAGKQVLSATHILIKDNACLWLKPNEAKQNLSLLISEDMAEVYDPVHLRFEFIEGKVKVKNPIATEIYVDADKLQYPLMLRYKREGDVFFPFGMNSKKKLSKFFTDEKYTQIEREDQVLLCSGDDIVWVVGKRLDDRFKVTKDTKRAVKIRCEPHGQV
ncbi:tRNA(Ile)-lysidine synthase [Capnocytophaga sp. HP1101]